MLGADLPGAVGRLHQRPAHAALGHLERAHPGPQAHLRALGARRRRHHVHQLADAVGGEQEPVGRRLVLQQPQRPLAGDALEREPVDLLQVRPHHPVDEGAAEAPAQLAGRRHVPRGRRLGRVGTLVEVAAAHHPPLADARHRAVHPAQVAAQKLLQPLAPARPVDERDVAPEVVAEAVALAGDAEPAGHPVLLHEHHVGPAAGERERGPQARGASSQHEGVGGGHHDTSAHRTAPVKRGGTSVPAAAPVGGLCSGAVNGRVT